MPKEKKTTSYKYLSLREAYHTGDKLVNAYGVVTEWGTPRATRGSDWMLYLKVIDPTVRDITFTGSTADTAVMTFHSNATFINCTFLDNAGFLGGGFYNLNGGPSFIDCRFIDNTATSGGARICTSSA